MKEKTITIAEEFSRFPSGRYRADGDFTGESFREDFLVPALSDCDKLNIDLDGVKGLSSSFLEEAFGGLVRKHRLSKEDLLEKIKVVGQSTKSDIYAKEIRSYIQEAE